ncbi:MAG TPA: ethanolamine ammonia-lyase subunit EutB, partial [Pirellulales bacterium]|nr:ethanolamine ammonia-lyase subunit EutB [Pirellulales bacterium]
APLDETCVPGPAPDEVYRTSFLGDEFTFHGLKRLLGAADVSKAGDRGAGLAAKSEVEREAARAVLSSLTLEHLYERPLTDDRGQVDAVMRVNYDIDRPMFERVAPWTVGQLKDHLLEAPAADVQQIGFALTGVMAAAVAKLMDAHELVYAARKFQRPSRARTRLGLPGTLSSRLQPNHPSDDLRSITWLIYAGFSLGGGDALIGVNPAIDTVANVSAILRHIDTVRRDCGAPTQVCVLAHVKTQLACLDRGAPVEIMFQSLAGTEATLTGEFDVTVELLDHAWQTMRDRGPLVGQAENFMYFETGQGSEYTYGKHQGIDMTTTEALCYGLARRYRPFMVNNVTGFIGPETHVDNFEMIAANLQDHFLGKLLGLPMGMAPCYTLHSQITLDGQQMATQLVAAAGANYYMDVCLNTDRMLAYFDTSAHDSQTLRELHGRTTTPEFCEWAIERGIFQRTSSDDIVRGPNWGNPHIFCRGESEYQSLLRATPAVPGFTHAGPRPANDVSRQLRLHQAKAREAIHSELDLDLLRRLAPFQVLHTEATNKEQHLNDPGLGARLTAASAAELSRGDCDVQIVVSDGLSAEAVHANIEELLPVMLDGLESRQLALGGLFDVRYGRVKLAEAVAERTGARLTVLLIGERPGGDALAALSLSAYLLYQLSEAGEQREAARFSNHPGIRFEYTVVSNIYSGGLPAVEAGAMLVERACQILEHRAAGNRLETLVGTSPGAPG